jgi:rare lipoprotein A (peptidoglycan hydrolase)
MIIFVLPGCHTKRVADRSASIQQETPPPWNYALPKPTFKRAPTFKQVGEASWYGPGFHCEFHSPGFVQSMRKIPTCARLNNRSNLLIFRGILL